MDKKYYMVELGRFYPAESTLKVPAEIKILSGKCENLKDGEEIDKLVIENYPGWKILRTKKISEIELIFLSKIALHTYDDIPISIL